MLQHLKANISSVFVGKEEVIDFALFFLWMTLFELPNGMCSLKLWRKLMYRWRFKNEWRESNCCFLSLAAALCYAHHPNCTAILFIYTKSGSFVWICFLLFVNQHFIRIRVLYGNQTVYPKWTAFRPIISQWNRNLFGYFRKSSTLADCKWKVLVLRAPNDPVRREMFRLEKSLKPSLARNRGESVSEWINRLQRMEGIETDKNTVIGLYHEVRYGNETLKPEQQKAFAEALQRIKNKT